MFYKPTFFEENHVNDAETTTNIRLFYISFDYDADD